MTSRSISILDDIPFTVLDDGPKDVTSFGHCVHAATIQNPQDYALIEAKLLSSAYMPPPPIKNMEEFKAQYRHQWDGIIPPSATKARKAHTPPPSAVQPLNPAYPVAPEHPFTAQLSWPTRRIDARTGPSAGYSYLYTASKPYNEYKPYVSFLARLTTVSDMYEVAGLDARALVGPLDYNGLTIITSRAPTLGGHIGPHTLITRYYISRVKPQLVVTCGMACADADTAALYDFDNVCAAIDARAALIEPMTWGAYLSNLGFPHGTGSVNHRSIRNPFNAVAMDAEMASILYRDWNKTDGHMAAPGRFRHLQMEPPSWEMYEYRIAGPEETTFLGFTSKSDPIACTHRGGKYAASWDWHLLEA